jgi:hypothetical protein
MEHFVQQDLAVRLVEQHLDLPGVPARPQHPAVHCLKHRRLDLPE